MIENALDETRRDHADACNLSWVSVERERRIRLMGLLCCGYMECVELKVWLYPLRQKCGYYTILVVKSKPNANTTTELVDRIRFQWQQTSSAIPRTLNIYWPKIINYIFKRTICRHAFRKNTTLHLSVLAEQRH